MLRCDQRPASEARGRVRLTDRQTEFPMFPPSVPVRTIVSSWKLFTSRLTPSPAAVLTSNSTLFTSPVLLPAETGGERWRGKGRHKSRSALSPISATKWVICECSWIIYCNGKLLKKGFGLVIVWQSCECEEHYSAGLVLLCLWFYFIFLIFWIKSNHFHRLKVSSVPKGKDTKWVFGFWEEQKAERICYCVKYEEAYLTVHDILC